MRQNQRINQYKENQNSEKFAQKQPIEENRRLTVRDRRRRDKSAIGAAKMPWRTVGEVEKKMRMERRRRARERERARRKTNEAFEILKPIVDLAR